MELKLPEGFDNREDAIKELIRKIDEEGSVDLPFVRESVREFLIRNKGYREEEIKLERKIEVSVGDQQHISSVDIVVILEGRSCMAVKCVSGSLESRERHALVIGRLLETHQVPYSVITNGMNVALFDTITGKVIGEDFPSIPTREELLTLVSGRDFPPLSPVKREMVAKILMAFDALECPTGNKEVK